MLSFDEFWQWLLGHPNCIISVGTPDAVLYDHDDFHWQLEADGKGEMLVQIVHGKQLVGEVVIPKGVITHVAAEEREEGEFLFECFVEGPQGPVASYAFTLSHGFSVEDDPADRPPGRWVH
jgi:hypothetical protein